MKSKPKTKKSQIPPGSWPGEWKGKVTKQQAWLSLLQLAKRKETFYWKGKWQHSIKSGQEHIKVKIPFPLDPGQVGCVKAELAKKWGWSRPKVQRFFKEFCDTGRVTQTLYDGIGTVITFLDIDKENYPLLWK